MSEVVKGFLQGVGLQTGGANSLLDFYDRRQQRVLQREIVGREYNLRLKELGVNEKDVEGLNALRASQESINAATARQTNSQINIVERNLYAEEKKAAYRALEAMRSRENVDTLEELVAVNPNAQRLLYEVSYGSPEVRAAIDSKTNLDPDSYEPRQIEGLPGGAHVVAGTSTINGEPTFLTKPGGELRGNDGKEKPVVNTDADLLAQLRYYNAIAGGASTADYQNLVAGIPGDSEEAIDLIRQNNSYTKEELAQLIHAVNSGHFSDEVIDVLTNNAGFTPASATANRTERAAQNTANRTETAAQNTANRTETAAQNTANRTERAAQNTANRTETAAQNTANRTETTAQNTANRTETAAQNDQRREQETLQAEVAADAARGANTENLRQVQIGFDEPNRVNRFTREEEEGQAEHHRGLLNTASDIALAPLQLNGLGFRDQSHESYRISDDPAENLAFAKSDIEATLADPLQTKQLEVLGLPADRDRWTAEQYTVATNVVLLSRRGDINNSWKNPFQPNDVSTLGRITPEGIRLYQEGASPYEKRGFFN